MTTITSKLLSKKGDTVSVTVERNMKMRKDQPVVTRSSTFECKIGANIDHTHTLAWGEWLEFPYTITHKDELYMCCSNHSDAVTRYAIDGVTVSDDIVKDMCLASEFKSTLASDVFYLKASNVVNVE